MALSTAKCIRQMTFLSSTILLIKRPRPHQQPTLFVLAAAMCGTLCSYTSCLSRFPVSPSSFLEASMTPGLLLVQNLGSGTSRGCDRIMSGYTGMVDSGSVAQFMDVTGASQEAAKFFLESSGGVVDAAVDQFFATGGEFSAAGAPEEETVEHDNVVPPGKQFLGITPSFASGIFYTSPRSNTWTMSSFSLFSVRALHISNSLAVYLPSTAWNETAFAAYDIAMCCDSNAGPSCTVASGGRAASANNCCPEHATTPSSAGQGQGPLLGRHGQGQ